MSETARELVERLKAGNEWPEPALLQAIVARGSELIVWNRTPDVAAVALVDGHRVAELEPGGRAVARLGEQRSLLATLPEVTFFSRYSRTLAS